MCVYVQGGTLTPLVEGIRIIYFCRIVWIYLQRTHHHHHKYKRSDGFVDCCVPSKLSPQTTDTSDPQTDSPSTPWFWIGGGVVCLLKQIFAHNILTFMIFYIKTQEIIFLSNCPWLPDEDDDIPL